MKIIWNGRESTRMRPTPTADKITVEPGDSIEVSEEYVDYLRSYHGSASIVVVDEDGSDQVEEKSIEELPMKRAVITKKQRKNR